MIKRDKIHMLLPFLLLIISTAGIAGIGRAQDESCTTGKCHANIGKEKTVHNPVKEGMCTICHQAVQGDEKTSKHPGNLVISLVQQGADLCYMCHEARNKKKVVHAPIMGGDCVSCHNPHQSPNRAMLVQAVPDICFQCHPDSMVKHKVMHPPAAAGDCSGCHDNHESDFSYRLVQEGNGLCFMCHPDKEEDLKVKKSVHPPVKQACTLCHNPHGSSTKAVLNSAVPQLCSNCHPGEASLTLRALVKHGPMNNERACMNCHEPHAADVPKLTLKAQIDLCLSCHDREIETEQGRIKNMKLHLEINKNGHGPVRDADCTGCHNPHGSDYWRILKHYFPSEFYTAYSDGKYDICFFCHDKSAFARLRSVDATNFRNGDKNLHFVHVNKSAKGRTCRSCHEVHADGGSLHHVRESVDFGNWTMPMNYNPGKNGGTCAPGCHGEKKYVR